MAGGKADSSVAYRYLEEIARFLGMKKGCQAWMVHLVDPQKYLRC